MNTFSTMMPCIQLQDPSQAFKCAYVMMIMAAFWVTEALPLAITSLLPVALLPLLGNNATVIFSLHSSSSVFYEGEKCINALFNKTTRIDAQL